MTRAVTVTAFPFSRCPPRLGYQIKLPLPAGCAEPGDLLDRRRGRRGDAVRLAYRTRLCSIPVIQATVITAMPSEFPRRR